MNTLKLNPISYDIKHCYLNGLATITYWAAKEFILIFAHTWYFEYNIPDGDILGDRIETIDIEKTERILKEYYGITIKHVDKVKFNNLTKTIFENLEKGLPTGIVIDPFYCPWIPVYKTDHGDHFIIIVGAEPEKEIFYCVDSFFSKKTEEISFEDLSGGYLSHKTINLQKDARKEFIVKELLAEILTNTLDKQSHCSNSFDGMRKFACELVNIKDLTIEKGDSRSFDSVPLILHLTFIVNNRLNFIKFLQYLYSLDKSIQMDDYIDQFNQLSIKWEANRQLLLKAFFLPDATKLLAAISKTINEISFTEQDLAESFLQALN